MRIAMLSDCYPPRLGGIETQVRDLARQLRLAGNDVHVFTATPDAASGVRRRNVVAEDDHGVVVHRVTLRLPLDLPVNPLAPHLVRGDLAGFDVAHVHMGVVSPFATDMVALALRLGIPTAVTWHCVLSRTVVATHRRLGLIRRWHEQGAALSAVSRMAADLVSRAGDGAPVSLLPNGIDPAMWRSRDMPPGRASRSSNAEVRIVTAMRMTARKRIRPLLAMLRQVHAADPGRVTASVFGDGPLLSLARVSTRRDQGWLRCAGRVSREQLAQTYAESDIYLAPTRKEAFGIAALEARSAGLAVVAVGSSGVADFVTHEVDGLLAQDDAGLVAACRRLVTDDALRERIRGHNRAEAPAQDWPHVTAVALAEYARAGTGG